MVGDPKIFEASVAPGLSHRFQRFRPVRCIAVAMQDSAKVIIRDELRQLALERPFDFAA